MATALVELPAVDPDSGRLNVIVDSPKGSRNKYKFDKQLGQWLLSKVLPQGMFFPFDFGFVPSTCGDDGDPVDVLVLMDEPAFPGCIVRSRLLGVMEAEQTEAGQTIRNDRLIAAMETEYNPAEYRSIDEINEQRIAEIEQFFISYNRIEGRKFKPLRRCGVARAEAILNAASRLPHGQERSNSKQPRRGKSKK